MTHRDFTVDDMPEEHRAAFRRALARAEKREVTLSVLLEAIVRVIALYAICVAGIVVASGTLLKAGHPWLAFATFSSQFVYRSVQMWFDND